MSEAEIAYQMSEYLDRMWAMQQWWASISIGVLIMAHLASSRLNLFLVCISAGMYTAYTLYMTQMMVENYQTIVALVKDMEVLVDAGVVNSYTAREVMAIENTQPVLYYVTFGGTFICVVTYLIYSYVTSRGSKASV